MILNTLEVVGVPAAALAAQEDLDDNARWLARILEAMQTLSVILTKLMEQWVLGLPLSESRRIDHQDVGADRTGNPSH